jgi:hypothetical protein
MDDGRVDRHGDHYSRRERPENEAPTARRGLGLGSQYVSHQFLPLGGKNRPENCYLYVI